MPKGSDAAKGDAQSTGRPTSRNATRSSTECSCDCGDPQATRLSLHNFQNVVHGMGEYLLCECTFCGPTLEDGSRRCTVEVDPIVDFLVPRFESRETYVPVLFCGDCRGHNIQLMRLRKRAKTKDHREAECGGRAANAEVATG